jgi:L-lysine exporter family protein LysE/ArgO
MENFVFGFYLGMSLILAVGPQNIFVIEQGLKRNHIFLVCLICSVSDFIFIAIGTAAFYYFSKSNPIVDLTLNLLLIPFILKFIWNKLNYSSHLYSFDEAYSNQYVGKVVLKTLAFTYLNPHVYSDTIFIIGGFSRELIFNEKIFFAIGASTASFIYFFSLGYASSYFANFINNQRSWRLINIIVISSMVFLSILISHKILTIIRSIT